MLSYFSLINSFILQLIVCLRGHSKSASLRIMGRGLVPRGLSRKKWQKIAQGVVSESKKLMWITQNFSLRIFSSTQFSFLCISWGSNNNIMNNKKNKFKRPSERLRKLFYQFQSTMISSFCQHSLLIPLYVYVKVREEIC